MHTSLKKEKKTPIVKLIQIDVGYLHVDYDVKALENSFLFRQIVSSLRGDSPIQKANILPGPTHEAAVVLALDLNSDSLRAQWKCGFYWYESNLQMNESNPQMNPFSSQKGHVHSFSAKLWFMCWMIVRGRAQHAQHFHPLFSFSPIKKSRVIDIHHQQFNTCWHHQRMLVSTWSN